MESSLKTEARNNTEERKKRKNFNFKLLYFIFVIHLYNCENPCFRRVFCCELVKCTSFTNNNKLNTLLLSWMVYINHSKLVYNSIEVLSIIVDGEVLLESSLT